MGPSDTAPGCLAGVVSNPNSGPPPGRTAAPLPVGSVLLILLHTLEEAAGEEGHGHEQDDGAAHDGGDHCHLEAEGLVWWYG